MHWRYLASEIAYRWKRAALLIGGIALAATLVVMLDILGRAFADVATVPFRNLGADLIVQRSATQSALPKEMGIMLPYSAQPITPDELKRLSAEPGVTQAAGFVLLWNLGGGRFYSISGIPLDANAPALGPGRAREWLIAGRLPAPGQAELLVERHYGAFYRLAPGSAFEISGKPFTIVGVVDIKEGSQIAASNFYMDIGEARALAALPAGLVNQVFLKVADMAATETVKHSIAAWLPRASIASPGTMLQLFGGVSQTIGRFGPLAVAVGAAAALALSAMLVLGVIAERRRELAVLRVLGWQEASSAPPARGRNGRAWPARRTAGAGSGRARRRADGTSRDLAAGGIAGRKSGQLRDRWFPGREQRRAFASRDHAVGLARPGRGRDAGRGLMGLARLCRPPPAEPMGRDQGVMRVQATANRLLHL